MYQKYFGLSDEPFSIAVNPHYLYMSERHREALAHLLYGVSDSGGIILLTGEVGTGKTTITRCLLKQLPDTTDVALVLNPALSAAELLAAVCQEFGLETEGDEHNLKRLSDTLHHFLLDNHRRGRNTVLLIDEAQHLKPEVLEQIRLLTNLETETRKLLKIILVGQPELRSLLAQEELRQVAQRVTARYTLQPLDLAETDAYIRHRLMVAGLAANAELFPSRVVARIHRASRGIPRLINILCDRMLLGTYGRNRPRVDHAMARQAIAEVFQEEPNTGVGRNTVLAVVGFVAALAVMPLLWIWWQDWSGGAKIELHPTEPARATAQIPPAPIQPDPPPAPVEEIEPTPQEPVWFDNEAAALDALLASLQYRPTADETPCEAMPDMGLRCESTTVETWPELFRFNRPAVLELLTPARFRAYAALIGVWGEQALLVSDGEVIEYPLAELGPLWTGDFVFFWQPPPDYVDPIGPRHSGGEVKWLADQFARLDGEQTPLSSGDFNPRLAERIRMFQRHNGLEVDGIAGMLTLLMLNEKLGREATLDSVAMDRLSGL